MLRTQKYSQRILFYMALALTLICWVAFIGINPVQSTEIDSFTLRFTNIHDSRKILNEMTQQLLEEVRNEVNEQNKLSQTCTREDLLQAVIGKFHTILPWGVLERQIEGNPFVHKRKVRLEDSIYSNFDLLQSFPLFLGNLASILRVGDHIVGSDKFGHFFDEGLDYYLKAFAQGKGIAAALQYGEKLESGKFGLWTTGIYSYGDLSANYHGMLFYARIMGLKNVGPSYFACDKGQWRWQNSFDWDEFIDASWDEGVNCNTYWDAEYEEDIRLKVQALAHRWNRSFTCPLEKNQCHDLKNKYDPNLHSHLISPKCLQKEISHP